MADYHDADFKAEYAKSNRASCKLCSGLISKDTLRLAIMIQVSGLMTRSLSWLMLHTMTSVQWWQLIVLFYSISQFLNISHIIAICIRTPACAPKQGTLPRLLHLGTDVNVAPVGRNWLRRWFQTLNLSFTFYIYMLHDATCMPHDAFTFCVYCVKSQ